MALDTPIKRASSLNLYLPFGRSTQPRGSNLITLGQREASAQGYAQDPAAPVGVLTSAKRRSSINLYLPFARSNPVSDAANMSTGAERQVSAYGYALTPGTSTFGYAITGGALAQNASISGNTSRVPVPALVRASPRVTGKIISWDAIVRMADGEDYRTQLQFACYTFGGGQVRRVFTQLV